MHFEFYFSSCELITFLRIYTRVGSLLNFVAPSRVSHSSRMKLQRKGHGVRKEEVAAMAAGQISGFNLGDLVLRM